MNIIFFDNECLICNRFVQLLHRIDHQNQLYFASLNSQTANRYLKNNYNQIDSVIYRKNGQIFIYSDAVIEILIDVGIKVTPLKRIPKFIRDTLYQFVARNRHYISKNSCLLSDPQLKTKILD
ncbi:DUF393 domain-containing protein [Macrococcus hajekii]|uniref:DUF393 domain-containing protein n=1 Tax=Macrococcus hajekii TaxID=198482 RepID=A0A4R6BLW7_9STAP|nr:DUF393 domain-containing protein [Macrococcus hajekii]GGB03999.1 hypothetical protein GCM10007190_10040 [Macrococcus hajekii]